MAPLRAWRAATDQLQASGGSDPATAVVVWAAGCVARLIARPACSVIGRGFQWSCRRAVLALVSGWALRGVRLEKAGAAGRRWESPSVRAAGPNWFARHQGHGAPRRGSGWLVEEQLARRGRSSRGTGCQRVRSAWPLRRSLPHATLCRLPRAWAGFCLRGTDTPNEEAHLASGSSRIDVPERANLNNLILARVLGVQRSCDQTKTLCGTLAEYCNATRRTLEGILCSAVVDAIGAQAHLHVATGGLGVR